MNEYENKMQALEAEVDRWKDRARTGEAYIRWWLSQGLQCHRCTSGAEAQHMVKEATEHMTRCEPQWEATE